MSTLRINVLPKPLIAPTVDAGANQNIQLPVNSANFFAVANDTDGYIESYLWERVIGGFDSVEASNILLSGVDTPNLSVDNLVAGTFQFRITVQDEDGQTATDTVSITVQPANQSPIANAGTNQNINTAYQNALLDSNYDAVNLGQGNYRFKIDQNRAQLLLEYFNSDGNSGLEILFRTINTVESSQSLSTAYHTAEILTIETFNGSPSGVIIVNFDDGYDPIPNTYDISTQGNQNNLQAVFRKTHAILDGTGSYDPENSILTYQWSITNINQPEENLVNLVDETASTAKLRGLLLAGSTYIITLVVEDEQGVSESNTTTITTSSVSGLTEGPSISAISSFTDSNNNQIGRTQQGELIDINGHGDFLNIDIDISQIDSDESPVTVSLINSSGATVTTTTVNAINTQTISAQLDISNIVIGTENSPEIYTLKISIQDSRSRTDEVQISISLFDSGSAIGKSSILIKSNNETACSTVRVVTVVVPSGEARDVEIIQTSSGDKTTAIPGSGTITEDTDYTLTITGSSGSQLSQQGQITDKIIIKSKKAGSIEAAQTLTRNHSGTNC